MAKTEAFETVFCTRRPAALDSNLAAKNDDACFGVRHIRRYWLSYRHNLWRYSTLYVFSTFSLHILYLECRYEIRYSQLYYWVHTKLYIQSVVQSVYKVGRSVNSVVSEICDSASFRRQLLFRAKQDSLLKKKKRSIIYACFRIAFFWEK